MQIALYEPEIAPNTAAILRTAVCMALKVHIIGAPSFDLSDRALRRAGLDYAHSAAIVRHLSFEAFAAAAQRIVLFTTHAECRLDRFAFAPGDTLLFGRESSGVPQTVHERCTRRVRIPLASGARSLNLAAAVAIGAFHGLATTGGIDEKGLR